MRTTCTLPVRLETCPKASMRRTSDADLVEAIAVGDREALGTLFVRHNVRIHRFINRFTGNASLAEDVVSEVFIAVWRAAGGLQEKLPGLDLVAGDCTVQGDRGAQAHVA